MNLSAALVADRLSFAYGRRRALDELSLEIPRGQIFGILGPNGGGKSTLFRLASTLLPLQQGELSVLGFSARAQRHAIRQRLGVVFQSPSLDRKLSVAENLWQQAQLYGLSAAQLATRRQQLVAALGLADRLHHRVESLSGGLARRVELAKGLLHDPQLLLLDEPSTGLDPLARADLWSLLRRWCDERGVSVVLTTHLLEEADKADGLALIHQGRLVASGRPAELRASLGGDSITLETAAAAELARDIADRFQLSARVVDGSVRLEQPDGPAWIARLLEAFPAQIAAVRVGKPSLEDLFIARTGHRLLGDAPPVPSEPQPASA